MKTKLFSLILLITLFFSYRLTKADGFCGKLEILGNDPLLEEFVVCPGLEYTYKINYDHAGDFSGIGWYVTGGKIVAINGVRTATWPIATKYENFPEPPIDVLTEYTNKDIEPLPEGIVDMVKSTLSSKNTNYVTITIKWGNYGADGSLNPWSEPPIKKLEVVASRLGLWGQCFAGPQYASKTITYFGPPMANIGNLFKQTEATNCLDINKPVLLTANVPAVQWYFLPVGSVGINVKLTDSPGVIEGTTTGNLLIYPPKNGVPANGQYYFIQIGGCSNQIKTSNKVTLDLKQHPRKPLIKIGELANMKDFCTLTSTSDNNTWYTKFSYGYDFSVDPYNHSAVYTLYKYQATNLRAFVEVKNLYGCSTRSDTILVPPFPGYRMGNDNSNEIENGSLSLAPNPALSLTTLEIGFENITKVELMDLQGKLLKNLKAETSQEINLSDMPPGMYFINIHCADGIKQKKLEVMK